GERLGGGRAHPRVLVTEPVAHKGARLEIRCERPDRGSANVPGLVMKTSSHRPERALILGEGAHGRGPDQIARLSLRLLEDPVEARARLHERMANPARELPVSAHALSRGQ